MSEFYFIINPASRSGKNCKLIAKLQAWLPAHLPDAKVAFTSHPGHATSLAQAACAQGVAKIVAVGGDGTLHEVLNGIAVFPCERQSALGLITAGTGGDFFRLLKERFDYEDPFAWLTQTGEWVVDLGWATLKTQNGHVTREYFINIAHGGMTGDVTRRVNASAKKFGSLEYLKHTLAAAWSYRAMPVHIRCLQQQQTVFEKKLDLLAFVVANGRYFGGGMCIAPSAQADDGRFQCLIAEKLGYLSVLRQLPRIYTRQPFRHSKICYAEGNRLEIVASEGKRFAVDLDGESYEANHATFELVPRKLKLLVPRERTAALS